MQTLPVIRDQEVGDVEMEEDEIQPFTNEQKAESIMKKKRSRE